MSKIKLILAWLIVIVAILTVVLGLTALFIISPDMIYYILIGVISAITLGWALDYLWIRRLKK